MASGRHPAPPQLLVPGSLGLPFPSRATFHINPCVYIVRLSCFNETGITTDTPRAVFQASNPSVDRGHQEPRGVEDNFLQVINIPLHNGIRSAS